MSSMMERRFLLTISFIFTIPLLVLHRVVLFITSTSTVLHCQPLRWRNLLLVLSIMLKKKEIKREKDIIKGLNFTVTEFFIMEVNY